MRIHGLRARARSIHDADIPLGRLDDRARGRLQAWLEASEITQTTLAEAIGKPQGYISRYLARGGRLDLDALEALAHVFDHSIAELLADEDPGHDARLRSLLADYAALPPELRAAIAQTVHVLARAMRRRRPSRRGRPR